MAKCLFSPNKLRAFAVLLVAEGPSSLQWELIPARSGHIQACFNPSSSDSSTDSRALGFEFTCTPWGFTCEWDDSDAQAVSSSLLCVPSCLARFLRLLLRTPCPFLLELGPTAQIVQQEGFFSFSTLPRLKLLSPKHNSILTSQCIWQKVCVYFKKIYLYST